MALPQLDNHDSRISYYELMLEGDLSNIPELPLPEGYRYAFFQEGDRDDWIAIEQSAKEFSCYEEGLNAWTRYYAGKEQELTDRMVFVLNGAGERIATATAFYDVRGLDQSGAGWLHWVAVKREWQGKGLSKPLISHVCQVMKALGYTRAKIPTQTTTWLACKVYLDLGFRPIEKNFIRCRDGWRIVKRLTDHPALADLDAAGDEDVLSMTGEDMLRELQAMPESRTMQTVREGALIHVQWQSKQGKEIRMQFDAPINEITLMFDAWHGHYETDPANIRRSFQAMLQDFRGLYHGKKCVYSLHCGDTWLQSGLLDASRSQKSDMVRDVLEDLSEEGKALLRVEPSNAHVRFWDSKRDLDFVFDPREWQRPAMTMDILTIFPEMFQSVLNASILGRAREEGILEIEATDIRPFSKAKHKNTDDYPFGGGAGMLMMAQPIADCIKKVCERRGVACAENTDAQRGAPNVKRIYLSPRGVPLTQKLAQSLAGEEHLILLCGHYEGVDQRVLDKYIDLEVSIGDYVITGGELGAMVLCDCVARLIPGVLGSEESPQDESFSDAGLLEYPQYTRPRVFEGMEVPQVLLEGDHARIAAWRREQALCVTAERRPDLLQTAHLTEQEKKHLQLE